MMKRVYAFANNKGGNQPVYQHSLINVFIIRCQVSKRLLFHI